MSLPHGFRESRQRGSRVAWDDAFSADVRSEGWDRPEGFAALLRGEAVAAGRGRTVLHRLEQAGVSWLVRPVLHGGWLGGWLHGALHTPARAFEELRVTAALRGAGAPVPRPALAAARRRGLVWNALVATVREEDAPDFLEWMAGSPERERVLRAVAASARAIRRFHDAGGSHADLHVKNVLVRERDDGCEAVIVDLDGASAGAPPDPARRMAEIARLYRSVLKRGLADTLGTEALERFLASYVDGDGALGAALDRHWPRQRRSVALHALAYPRRRGGS